MFADIYNNWFNLKYFFIKKKPKYFENVIFCFKLRSDIY